MQNGWVREYEGNFWFYPILNELYYDLGYRKLTKIVKHRERFYCIFQKFYPAKTIVFYHKAGIASTKEFYFNIFVRKGFLQKYLKMFAVLRKKFEKDKKQLLAGKKLEDKDIATKIVLGAAFHFITQPHCMGKIEEEIKKIAGKRLKSKQTILLNLLQPEEPTTLSVERVDWLKLLIRVKSGKSKIDVELENHREKYCFIDVIQKSIKRKNDLTITKEELQEKLKKDLKLNEKIIEKELNNLEQQQERIRENKRKLFAKYGFSKEEIRLFRIHSLLSHYRFEGRLIWQTYFCLFISIVRKLSREKKVSAKIIGSFSYVDFRKLLDKKDLPYPKFPKTLLYYKNGGEKLQIFASKIAAKQIKKLELRIEIPKIDRLKGETAFPGYVKGIARVIKWDKSFQSEMDKMKKGEILIVNQTKPSLMKAIRKAAGIVTNEGGLISHASIISKELKIPCIIQTNFATEIFKTGDKIILNAKEGVVSKYDY